MKTIIGLIFIRGKWWLHTSSYDSINDFYAYAKKLNCVYKEHELPITVFTSDKLMCWSSGGKSPVYYIDPDTVDIDITYTGADCKTLAEFAFDPNVRVDGNQTYVGFEDLMYGHILGPGQKIKLYESESKLEVQATIARIDDEKQLIYCNVDWSQYGKISNCL